MRQLNVDDKQLRFLQFHVPEFVEPENGRQITQTWT